MAVSGEEGDAVREALLDLGFDGVVVGGAGVIAIGRDVLETRVGLEKLGGSDGFGADGA